MTFAATWMDLEIIILSEVVRQTKTISYDVAYMQNLKEKWYKWIYLQNRNTHKTETLTKQKQQLRERIYGYQGERVGVRDRLRVWDWHVRTTVYKIDNRQAPTA